MPIKVLDASNFGQYSWWAQGIDFAVSNGAKIINLSAGGGGSSSALTQAITSRATHLTVTELDAIQIGNPTENSGTLHDISARVLRLTAQLDQYCRADTLTPIPKDLAPLEAEVLDLLNDLFLNAAFGPGPLSRLGRIRLGVAAVFVAISVFVQGLMLRALLNPSSRYISDP